MSETERRVYRARKIWKYGLGYMTQALSLCEGEDIEVADDMKIVVHAAVSILRRMDTIVTRRD